MRRVAGRRHASDLWIPGKSAPAGGSPSSSGILIAQPRVGVVNIDRSNLYNQYYPDYQGWYGYSYGGRTYDIPGVPTGSCTLDWNFDVDYPGPPVPGWTAWTTQWPGGWGPWNSSTTKFYWSKGGVIHQGWPPDSGGFNETGIYWDVEVYWYDGTSGQGNLLRHDQWQGDGTYSPSGHYVLAVPLGTKSVTVYQYLYLPVDTTPIRGGIGAVNNPAAAKRLLKAQIPWSIAGTAKTPSTVRPGDRTRGAVPSLRVVGRRL